MFSAVLALAMVGGWGGGSSMPCASPAQSRPAPAAYRTYRVGTQIDGRGTLVYDGPAMQHENPKPTPVYGWHPVEHEGLRFQAWGYITENGQCRWYASVKENRENWDRAKEAAQAAKNAKAPAQVAPKPDINLTGIDPTKFRIRPDMYTTTSHEARQFVEGIRSDDARDYNKIYVTVIGSEDECKPVVADLNRVDGGPFFYMRGELLVNEYRPKEWQVDPSLGFPIAGHPAIIVQSAKGPLDPVGGKVLYRANDYSMGPKGLAEAIRKVNPNYKPQDDPGPATGKTDEGPLAFLLANPIIPVSAVAFVLLFLISPKRKDG